MWPTPSTTQPTRSGVHRRCPAASTSWTPSISYAFGTNTHIGKHGNGDTNMDFVGRIDEARIYSRALTVSGLPRWNRPEPADTVAITTVNRGQRRRAGADKTELPPKTRSMPLHADRGFSDVDSNSLLRVWSIPPDRGIVEIQRLYLCCGQLDRRRTSILPIRRRPTGPWYILCELHVRVTDDGGTANGGVDTDPSANTITFNVTPVNDAPVITSTVAVRLQP